MSSGTRIAGTVVGTLLIIQGIGAIAQREIRSTGNGNGWYVVLYLTENELVQTLVSIIAVLVGVAVLFLTRKKESGKIQS